MAFTLETWARNSSSANFNAPVAYTYGSATDDLATIRASAYFNSKLTQLSVNDMLYLVGTDAVAIVRVTSVTTNVTVGDVTASGPTIVGGPIVHTWTGGGTFLNIPIDGVNPSTDIAFATFALAPTEPSYIAAASASTNSVSVSLSAANTSNDAQISLIVFRP